MELDALFSKLGISKVPEEGDGYDEVKEVHKLHSPTRFNEADNVTQGPLQTMFNSKEFRGSFGTELASSKLPYVFFDRELTVADENWNADALMSDLKGIILDRKDVIGEGFYVTVSYSWRDPVEVGPADVHWVGLEFRRGKSGDAVIVFDPAGGGKGPDTWPGADPIQYGLLIPLLSDPEVIEASGWNALPSDAWGDFKTRDETLRVAADIAIFDRAKSAQDVKLTKILRTLGVRLFKPKTSPCQVNTSDYFCQTWVLFLFGERSKGKSVEEIEKSIETLCGKAKSLKRLIIEFTGRAIASEAARSYWSKRELRRDVSGDDEVYTDGTDFLAWLKYSASLPEFGEDFLADECFANVTVRRGSRAHSEELELL